MSHAEQTTQYDLIIRNGLVYDGLGGKSYTADIAVSGDKIAAVGSVEERAAQEFDATGRIVTPGFVDAHTHYDGQITWDPYLSPSTYHGVTTAIMGNCGVGFAPCKPEQRDWLIGLMEGVEDIPGTALHEGIEWQWESFPEYLDTLENSPKALDVGTQIPHGALRAYVMGQRGPAHEPATKDDIDQMSQLVVEAVEAGALGFTTSRTEKHRDSSGVLTPTITAHEDELLGIAEKLGETGKGVLQGISDFYDFDEEFSLFRRMTEVSGRPCSITVEQQDMRPDWWRSLLNAISDAQAEGLPIRGQVPPRATGVLLGLTASLNPFLLHPSYREISEKSLEERVSIMRQAEFREKILAETPANIDAPLLVEIISSFHKLFRLGEPANYEPAPEDSFAEIAKAKGVHPLEIAYDCMLEKDGAALMYHPLFNYFPGDLSLVEEMLNHPHTTFGLSDGGAHCGALCDASFPTTLIQHWGRDRKRGNKIPLEKLISMQTKETAELVGLFDRGVLQPGYKADINIINFDALTLHEPYVTNDLPAGGRRLVQKASGYEATFVSGTLAFRQGEPTGALNGRLIRGPQAAPALMARYS
ncbi:MAG: amidohydrolase family protein [Pseudomonadota bacterium]